MITIPPQSMEIERIFSHLTAPGHRSVAVTACNADEGVSAVTLALAQRFLLSGMATLVVDLNLFNPSLVPLLAASADPGKPDFFPAPQLVSAAGEALALTGVAAPQGRQALMKLRKPGVLEASIAGWLKVFDVVLVDTSPLNRVNGNNIPAERVAAACDAAIMVVAAGRTTRAQVREGTARLQSTAANLAGCVLNDRHNPPLKSELVREIDRLGGRFTGLADRLRRVVKGNRLLSLDV